MRFDTTLPPGDVTLSFRKPGAEGSPKFDTLNCTVSTCGSTIHLESSIETETIFDDANVAGECCSCCC